MQQEKKKRKQEYIEYKTTSTLAYGTSGSSQLRSFKDTGIRQSNAVTLTLKATLSM